MKKKSVAGRNILAVYLVFLHIFLGILIYDKFFGRQKTISDNPVQSVIELPTPIEIPAQTNQVLTENTQTEINSRTIDNNINISAANKNSASGQNNQISTNDGKLLIPVSGIKKNNLRDTFNDARSEGRVHNAIDIMANGGTLVLAAADGEIAKFFESRLGGITIYQYSIDKKQVYYYAHLQKRAENLTEHQSVRQGTVIGYVGDTGNAGAGNFHLHFAISILDDPQRYWDGEEINPYPILMAGKEAN